MQQSELLSTALLSKLPITKDSAFSSTFIETVLSTLFCRQNSLGLKVNTIGKTIKHLRSFLKDRMSRKIIAEFDLSMFKTMEEPADAIYLNTEEIQTIWRLDLSYDHYLEQHRDLFVLGCYTGLRFSDFSIISKEDVRNGMLHKKQEKSNHWVIIPLRTMARYILEKKFKDGIPQVSNSEFNGTIKQI